MPDCGGSDSLSGMYPLGVIALKSPYVFGYNHILMGIQSVQNDNQLFKSRNTNFLVKAQHCMCFFKVRSVLRLIKNPGQNFPLCTNLLHILNLFHA